MSEDEVSTSENQQEPKRIENPFEEGLLERLSRPIVSPSMLKTPMTPEIKEKGEEFTWSIGQRSLLYPSHIEVSYQLTPVVTEKHKEQKIQSAIAKFFREHSIAPSPIVDTLPATNKSRILLEGFSKEVGTQTALSFPEHLPEHVQQLLQPYMSTAMVCRNEDEQNTSLRRKLRFSEESESYECDGMDGSPRDYNVSDNECDVRASSPRDYNVSDNEDGDGIDVSISEDQQVEFNSPASTQFSSSPISSPHFRSDHQPSMHLESPSLSPITKSPVDNVKLQQFSEGGEVRESTSRCLFSDDSQESGVSRDTGYGSQGFSSNMSIESGYSNQGGFQQDGKVMTSCESFSPTKSSTPRTFNAMFAQHIVD